MFTDFDHESMRRALALGREARFWARPNPAVGCVLTRDGAVIGEGYTQPAGGAHAEVMALRDAGDARGATAYVTLEPCAHQGRTGPCALALRDAGVTRVVAAVEDPNPRVAGGGFAMLRAAEIAVDVGLLAEQAERDLAGFLVRMRRGRGRVRLKMACSLDGRTAMASGESQWITGDASRQDVQLLRAESCAIVTGIGTLLADDCRLSVRSEQLPLSGDALERALAVPPLRVVLDTNGRAPAEAAVFSGDAPTAHLVAEGSDRSGVAIATGDDGHLDLRAVMDWLAAKSCNEILIEAGATLSGALLDADLVDELVIYMAPRLLGSTARSVANLSVERLCDARDFAYLDYTPIGDDLRIIAVPR